MRVRGLLAALAVGSVLVGGCADPQEANDTLPTATSAVEAEPTLAPLGPVDLPMPDEARAQTPQGAEAFVRYYMEIYNLAQESTDATFMRSLSQGCETCDFFAMNIESDRQSAYVYDGGSVAITAIAPPAVDGAMAEAAFSITQDALTVRDAAGSPVPDLTFPASSGSCGAVLIWSSGLTSWQFAQWDIN